MFTTAILASLFIVCITCETRWHELDSYNFKRYESEFNKHYTRSERTLRESIFRKNLENIRMHNRDLSISWKRGVNHLTDRTPEELQVLRGAKPNRNTRVHPNFEHTKIYNLAELESKNVDWREKGIVTPVKDQGNCGSCWSFATAEVLESHYALATGSLSDLSEQQILDCTPNPNQCGGTGGCGGGTVELAFDRIIKLGGLSSEWTYPYVSYFGAPQTCQFDPLKTKPFANLTTYYTLPSNSYAPLLNHIANNGPIAISVDASAWSDYETGVFDGCNQTHPDLDHAVVLVGYGTDDQYGPYWLVRNSWSSKWGDAGYIKLKRDTGVQRCGEDLTPKDGDGCADSPPEVKVCGTCGILYDNVYPQI